MNIDTQKSRVQTGDTPEVKVLKARVAALEVQVAELAQLVSKPEIKPDSNVAH